jgi:cytochrome b pre-mRNA-processing protein 3
MLEEHCAPPHRIVNVALGIMDIMPFRRIRERRRRERVAFDLYAAVVEAARRPEFYTGLGVPDSVDGRFDLIVLHAHLAMRRLVGVPGEEAKALSQALFDLMFADMDHNLREMGVSDLGVGNKVKDMAKAFFGRAAAYDHALAADEAALRAALERNLYGTVAATPQHVAGMAAYVRRQLAHVEHQDAVALLEGRLDFAPVDDPRAEV